MFAFAFLLPGIALGEPPIKIGVPLALTGDLAQGGIDQRNALTLMNEKFGNGRYELLFQDDRCSNTDALAIARKFIDVEKVKYVIGFMCNQTLVSTAPVYDRAGVAVFSGSGTSGDIPSLGKRNFRFFPSDLFGAERLFAFVRGKHKKVALLSEQTEYAEMMDRSFHRLNKEAGNPLTLSSDFFKHGDADFRTILTRIKNSPSEALFINADSDTSFITIIKQLSAIHFEKPRYTVYLGASASVLKAVGKECEGLIFSNLPPLSGLVSERAKPLIEEFKRRFGEPQSGFPVVPTTMEAFRMMDLAIQSGKPTEEFLLGKQVTDGLLTPYRLDENGNVTGLKFEMQTVKEGRAQLLEK